MGISVLAPVYIPHTSEGVGRTVKGWLAKWFKFLWKRVEPADPYIFAVGTRGSNSELNQLTLISLQSKPEVPILEHDVLEKVDILGCTEWNPKDQWEARSSLREHADVFAMDDLYLEWTSIVKHKIALKEGAKPIKEHYQGVPPGMYDEGQKHLQEMIDEGAITPNQ